MDPTKAGAEPRIVSLTLSPMERKDALSPKSIFDDFPELDKVFIVHIQSKTPSSSPEITSLVFASEESARNYMEEHPVGSVFPPSIPYTEEMKSAPKRYIIEISSRGEKHSMLTAGDPNNFLPLDVLEKSGVTYRFDLSKKAIKNIGADIVKEFEDAFGKNWAVAAELYYCMSNYPSSSAAVIAAKQRFNYYIIQDDFSSGYLLRELMAVCSGVDFIATQSEEMRRRAGESGSKASRAARSKRRLHLMEYVETVARRNPDILSLGEAAILALAVKAASENDPLLWRQGSGQAKEYLDEIRRGEAGDKMKARYHRLFAKTA